MIEGLPFRRLRKGAVDLVQGIDLGQHGFFGLIVLRAEFFRALEHHVLKVMSKAGVVRGVVLAAGVDGNVGLDPGLILVYGHINLQAIVQGIDLCLKGVSFHGFITGAAGHGR